MCVTAYRQLRARRALSLLKDVPVGTMIRIARFPEFRGMINDKSMANPENDSPSVITDKMKSSQPNLMILVLL